MKVTTEDPLIRQLQNYEPLFWKNKNFGAVGRSAFEMADVLDAEARLRRFAPCLCELFPEIAADFGVIESPLCEINGMKAILQEKMGIGLAAEDRLLLKCDHSLPISGSIKARGGIYEVLKYAESLAIEYGILSDGDDYRKLATADARALFSQFRLVAGSTGNLGLSIGIMGRKFGFNVDIHMSADARQWKKMMLRALGVSVHEHSGDFSQAVASGRQQALSEPTSHFIDDEYSADLFLGYAVAAIRLKAQLLEMGIPVDANHPLLVYLPCGVGGGPGGITFGLKQIFGNNVHCLIAEPTHAPAMLLGLMSGLWNEISIREIGIDGVTAADGLAVGRPSRLVCNEIAPLLEGCFTVSDTDLFKYLYLLAESEKIRIEPSACAGFEGLKYHGMLELIQGRAATHVVWSTGGNMVPEEEMTGYIEKGNLSFS